MHWGSCVGLLVVVGSVLSVPAKTKNDTSLAEHQHSIGEDYGHSFFLPALAKSRPTDSMLKFCSAYKIH